MKKLFLIGLLIFFVNVYADTYYCSQKSKISIWTSTDTFDENNVSKSKIVSKNIFKLQIDFKKKNVYFSAVEYFNKNKIKGHNYYKIDRFIKQELTSFTAVMIHEEGYGTTDISVLKFSNLKKGNYLTEIVGSNVLTIKSNYECYKEEKY